jgi:putative flavoprotein involved in K+ transport
MERAFTWRSDMLMQTSRSTRPVTRVERYETLVIGGGQAGLATGYHLARQDADFVILDADERVGDVWRRRWDSLRLFTPARYDGLPGMPFPAPPEHLPDKDEVADYLERYAERFDLPVRSRARVTSLEWNGARYVARSGAGTFEADNVVVATGPFQGPRIPEIAARLSPGIHQLHSSAYRNPLDLPDGPVLVVGAGNSGAQIALELARVRDVWLAGAETGRLPRRVLGRDVYRWLWPVLARLTIDTRGGRRLRESARRGDPLIGIPERAFAEAGVRRVGRVTDELVGMPVCDGKVVTPRVVVWCTGFAPDYSWIDLPVFDAGGRPRQHRGVVDEAPGLYFVGLRFQYRMTSALLGGVGADAEYVAAEIARRSAMVEDAAMV